ARPLRDRDAAGERGHVTDELPGVDVEDRPGEHADRGEEEVDEADARQPEGVVQQVEGEHGREAEEEDDLPPLGADGAVDGREARVRRDAPFHGRAREVTPDEERGRRAEDGGDEDVDHAPHEPEDDAGGEREDHARDEGDGRQHVARDERDRTPRAESLHPGGEAEHVAAGPAPEDDQRRQRGASDDEARDRGRAAHRWRCGGASSPTGRRLSDVRPWYASIAERIWRYPGQP